MSELKSRLANIGPIFNNDDEPVHTKIEESSLGKSSNSTIKHFSRRKDGRGSFQALVSNHAGKTKHRSMSKKRLNLFHNIKWNG